MKIIFIADFFIDQVLGGGELNNEEAMSLLKENNEIEVSKLQSHKVSLQFLQDNKDCKYIIANFVNLSPNVKQFIEVNCDYIIYEHDHKYLANRNPAIYKNFKAPEKAIVNYSFYKNALAVFCQSVFHESIIKKNLQLENIVNLGGNLWSLESLKKIKIFSEKEKKKACSIMNSSIPHKNASAAIKYCEENNKPFELIDQCVYYEFLDKMSNNDTFVFFPKTPETLSRIIVEARMMNMQVVTNSLVGATKEEWFSLKGLDLIEEMYKKRISIVKEIKDIFYDEKHFKRAQVSI